MSSRVTQPNQLRAAAVLVCCMGILTVATVLLVRDGPVVSRNELPQKSASIWGTGAPSWWSRIPVETNNHAGTAQVKINGIPVEGAGSAHIKVDGIPVEGLQAPAPAQPVPVPVVVQPPPPYHAWGTKPHDDYVADVGPAVARAAVGVVPGEAPCSRPCSGDGSAAAVPVSAPKVAVVGHAQPPPTHVWGTKPHTDYPETTFPHYRPIQRMPHHWGTRTHEDFAAATFPPYRPIRSPGHHWGTRLHEDFADDVFGKGYHPDPSIPHHWGTREHRDFAEDVFGKGYRPDPSIPHHWGTRSHGDYANDVFRAYRPDPVWDAHWGTHHHKDYVDDVYGHKYHPDPVVDYHWGTRKHLDYASDVYSRPFVSWDMPYGVAAPRAGGFRQDVSPSENRSDVMAKGTEDRLKRWYAWRGVRETGPGGTFKSWWPPGNRQQDVMGEGGNVVPTVRGDEGPNNYRIPWKDYMMQYASDGTQGPPPIAKFADMEKRSSWKSGTASLSAKAKAQLRLKAKHEMEATKLEGHAQQQEGTHGEHTGAVKDKVPKDERVQVDAGSRGRQGGGAQRSSGADVKRARTAVTWLHGISSQAPVAKARHTELVGIPVERGGVAGGHPLVRAVWNAAQGVHAARRSGEWGGEWRESSAWEAAREEKERQEQDEQGEEQQEQQFAAAERVQRVQDEEEDRKRMNQERWWQTREAQKKEVVEPVQAPMASWSYNPTASNGPQNWGLLSAAYAQCVNSLAQSPVNLPRADAREVNGGGSYLVPQGMPALSWEAPRPVEEGGSESMWSNANGVWSSEAAQDEPSSFEVVRRQGLELKAKGPRPLLVFDGRRFSLERMYLHTPSEHTVDGKHADAELQLLLRQIEAPSASPATRGRQSDVMMLSLLLSGVGGEGTGAAAEADSQEGGFLDAIVDMAARQAFDTDVSGPGSPSQDISGLLSVIAEQPRWYFYEGSLTRPPCTEGVRWLVSATSVAVPRPLLDQVKQLDNGDNVRPVQPLSSRPVELLAAGPLNSGFRPEA